MAEARPGNGAGIDDLTDEVLLERFTSQREEAAFAALVRRHGPLVLAVCRRVLQHEQDAEDAFQAVFCVFLRKAAAIRKRGAVGAWLHTVADRIARKARADRGRRHVSETNLPDIPAADGSPEWVWRELRPILDEEVSRLPEKYRRTFVLCYLEGKTNEQVAAELGCPLGTVLSRLARARDRLRIRLTRRGLALSGGALAVALSGPAITAAVSPALAQAAVRTAVAFGGGAPVAGGVVPVGVAALAQGFLNSLFRIKLLKAAGGILALAGLAAVLLLLRPPAQKPKTDQELLQGNWTAVALWAGDLLWAGDQATPPQRIRFNFAGDQCTFSFSGGSLTCTFRLDPNKVPKEIDFVPNKVSKGFEFVRAPGFTMPGIYRLEGDHLQLRLDSGDSPERPTTLDKTPHERWFLYELRRQ